MTVYHDSISVNYDSIPQYTMTVYHRKLWQ